MQHEVSEETQEGNLVHPLICENLAIFWCHAWEYFLRKFNFFLISWFCVCLFKVPEAQSKRVEPCDLWLTEYCFANKCAMTTNWKQWASVPGRSPFALQAGWVAFLMESVCTHPKTSSGEPRWPSIRHHSWLLTAKLSQPQHHHCNRSTFPCPVAQLERKQEEQGRIY